MPENPQQPSVTRSKLILDTNVCLDLFVFRDPRWAELLGDMQRGAAHVITRSDCRSEWLAVLNYPRLQLDAAAQSACAAECLPQPEPARSRPLLPTCSDRDDQKFLELAFDEKADILISKDKALLKLARRAERLGLFSILSPEAWHQARAQESGGIMPASIQPASAS